MAKILEEFDIKGRMGRKPTYPWGEWFCGKRVKLSRGTAAEVSLKQKDYSSQTSTLQKTIRNKAKEQEYPINIFTDDDPDDPGIIIVPRNLGQVPLMNRKS